MEGKNKFGTWYEAWLGRWIPSYGVLSVITCFLWNSLVYSGTQFLMRHAKHYDLTTKLDRKIPFVSQWIYVYLICFVFWAVNYILICREGKEHWYRFAVGDMLSRLICGICFLILPTTNVRPIVHGDTISAWLVQWIYQLDMPYNLFPSIHCLVSWFCYIGIRGSKKVPKWYQYFSAVFACMVFASTQFTKQHYLWDVVGGFVLAELCNWIGQHTSWYQGLERIFDKVGKKVFGGSDAGGSPSEEEREKVPFEKDFHGSQKVQHGDEL